MIRGNRGIFIHSDMSETLKNDRREEKKEKKNLSPEAFVSTKVLHFVVKDNVFFKCE